uniref:Uncharacterized protein n=1 Tax=Oryza rufipogon TaxID=4529 RepID=A0A0E0QPJ0_ORYRU
MGVWSDQFHPFFSFIPNRCDTSPPPIINEPLPLVHITRFASLLRSSSSFSLLRFASKSPAISPPKTSPPPTTTINKPLLLLLFFLLRLAISPPPPPHSLTSCHVIRAIDRVVASAAFAANGFFLLPSHPPPSKLVYEGRKNTAQSLHDLQVWLEWIKYRIRTFAT